MQTFIYTHVLQQQITGKPPIVAGIYDVRNMRKEGAGFNWQFTQHKGEPITELEMPALVNETMAQLQTVLEEIFDPTIPFDQTTTIEKCEYCPYKVLCGR